jgi:hypothetical protein
MWPVGGRNMAGQWPKVLMGGHGRWAGLPAGSTEGFYRLEMIDLKTEFRKPYSILFDNGAGALPSMLCIQICILST